MLRDTFSRFVHETVIHGIYGGGFAPGIELYFAYHFVFTLLLIGAAAESNPPSNPSLFRHPLLIYYESRVLKQCVHYVRFLAIEQRVRTVAAKSNHLRFPQFRLAFKRGYNLTYRHVCK